MAAGNAPRGNLAGAAEPVEDFQAFFPHVFPDLCRTLLLVTGSVHEAEDVAQEAMVRVFERWDRVRRMASPRGYAFKIALNLNRSRLRRLRRSVLALPRLLEAQRDPARPEERYEILELLHHLPVLQRESLVLTTWLGLSVDEVARIQGVAPPTVRVRVHRARTALRYEVRREG